MGHCGRSRGAVAAVAKIALDKARDKWDNSHMSTKRKEIRIRKVERVSYIRIAAAAAEAELSVPTFCLYAALAVCDTADQAERGKEPKA